MKQAKYDIGELFRVSHNYPDGNSDAQWHRHVEIIFPAVAPAVYDIAGHRLHVAPGQIALFSATIPHRVVQVFPGTEMFVINLPLELFFAWSLPMPFRSAIFHGEALLYDGSGLVDVPRLTLWHEDTISLDPYRVMLVLLEVQALVRRLALRETIAPEGGQISAHRRRIRSNKILSIIDYVSAHIQDAELDMGRIAAAVGLNPKYMITLFRQSTGVTLLAYIRRARAAVAHTLLLETSRPIADVALEAGFGSISQFYDVMKREIGLAPGTLRRLAAGDTPGRSHPGRAAPETPSAAVPDTSAHWLSAGAITPAAATERETAGLTSGS